LSLEINCVIEEDLPRPLQHHHYMHINFFSVFSFLYFCIFFYVERLGLLGLVWGSWPRFGSPCKKKRNIYCRGCPWTV